VARKLGQISTGAPLERPKPNEFKTGESQARPDKHFLPTWIRRRMMRHARVYDAYLYWTQVRRLLYFIGTGRNFFKSPETSLNIYQTKGDYEHQDYMNGSVQAVINGQIHRISHREARERYCAYLFEEIDRILPAAGKLRILEVGCGNCINLVLLKQRYGDRIELTGHDISERRIAVAKEFFGDKLDGITFAVKSATDAVPAEEESQFDFVFSMHCLEQIPFGVLPAVQGMYKRTRSRVVMIEPVFDFARPTQKLFLIYSDYTRTLLPTVRYLGYKILRAEPLNIESSLKNQSSIIVVEK
jgi:SAM-dependent methyltransferase